ncbi:MAG: ABC transporter permease subunit [Fimbriimonas sp.]
MSLVGRVGRRRPRARFAMAMLYLLLTLGAVTTLYPFALMVSTGLKGPTDQNDGRLVPAYLQEDKDLVAKYVDDKYAGDLFLIAATRGNEVSKKAILDLFDEFLSGLPMEYWHAGFRNAPNQVTSRLSVRYQNWLRARYGNDIDALNRAYIEENVAFQTVVPPSELLDRKGWKPLPGRRYEEWQEFKAALPAEFRIPLTSRAMFQRFLAAKYKNQFADVPKEIAGRAKAFSEVEVPASGPLREEFEAKIPPRFLKNSVESQWAAFTGDVSPMPIASAEAVTVMANPQAVRNEFAARNYAYVLDYILINGRAVFNTFLFCFLAIATQLTVNPLAAYALSRYPVRQSGGILIFLLATMAFPAEVAMIPSFLLLKDLGLLNTFAALVLPTAASGYMIFLLKGFFDSLPQELFEAAALDGAKETTMMFRIALPLSQPVMGYLALLAFMGAYGAFIYAFLVAQDQRIWTLMVWVYQLQNSAPKSVMMAALTLAAVPTLFVFLLAQNAITRGIVLPGER